MASSPRVLGDQGLVAALDDLAARLRVPGDAATAGVRRARRRDRDGGLRDRGGRAGPAGEPAAPPWSAVDVDAGDGTVTLRVEVGRAAGDLTDVADRVAAVGGDLSVDVTDGGTRIEARLPCAS